MRPNNTRKLKKDVDWKTFVSLCWDTLRVYTLCGLWPGRISEELYGSFVVDYEAGLWQAIRAVFPQPDIHGCAFHFGQALYRKVQEFGLQ
ncbi:hypothetical protein DPMN_165989, partial [Dreissena polymorpha]